MQTKSSYRVLKWILVLGAFATLGSACVVTADGGDDDDDFGEGGESGSSTTTAGKATTAGTGGSANAGSSTGGKGGAATAGASGEGGEPSGYVPGLCQDDLPVPSSVPSCAHDAKDEDPANACRTCLKDNCCEAWKTCFGDSPTTACGSGPTEEADGQFECIRGCALDDMSGDDTEDILNRCQDECLGQCSAKDQGFILDDTNALVGCGNDKCLVECFTP